MNASWRDLLVGALVLVMLIGAGCGRKTDPLTPASPRSEPVKDVTIVARDAVAFLSWPVPARNIEGKELNQAEIIGFRVFRAEVERDKKKLRYKQVSEIFLANPAPAEIRNGRVYWSDSRLRYGLVYSYRIRVVTARGGMSQPSQEVRVAPLLSLAAPRMLSAMGGDSHIVLAWDSVTTRADGSLYEGFVGYNVYRGTASGRYEDTPLNKEPLRTNSYKDSAVVNNKTYYYAVRSVDSPMLPWKESLNSPEASASSRDMVPPGKPTGLTVVPGVGRIFMTWNENKERDLAGYHVYRSARSGRNFERLTNKPINRSTYSDEKVSPGVVYYYAVSAIDQSGNEGVRSQAQKAFAEKLR